MIYLGTDMPAGKYLLQSVCVLHHLTILHWFTLETSQWQNDVCALDFLLNATKSIKKWKSVKVTIFVSLFCNVYNEFGTNTSDVTKAMKTVFIQLTRLLFRHSCVIYLDKYRLADLKQQSKSQRFRTKEKVKSKNCKIYNQAENTSLLIFCLCHGDLIMLLPNGSLG